jgi:hypothetical protein
VVGQFEFHLVCRSIRVGGHDNTSRAARHDEPLRLNCVSEADLSSSRLDTYP